MVKNDHNSDLLTIKQAARMLNVSEVSLRRWTNTGELACLRVGTHRARRFRREDLLAFMEQQSTVEVNHSTGKGEKGIRRTHIMLKGIAIDYGSHLCALYDNELGQQKLAIPLLAEGLRNGDICYLVATKQVQATMKQHLKDVGVDIKTAIDSGHLVVTEGMSSGAEMLDYLRKQFTLATRAGNRSLRLVGDMSWVLAKGWDLTELAAYELSFNNSLGHQYPVISLCQYDVAIFSGTGVLYALRCHEDTFRYPLGRFLGTGTGDANMPSIQ